MRDSCHILKVLNKTTKEENWRRIYHVCWFNHQFTAFYYFSTDQISPGPLVNKVLAYVAPSWYTQGLACGEGFGWDVERIRNTDLFSQFMEQASFIQRGRPITFYFSFSFFWDLKIDDGYGAVQIISFTRNDCYMDTQILQKILLILKFYIPTFYPKMSSILCCIDKQNSSRGVGKRYVFVRAFLITFLAKTTSELSWVLQCSHFRVYDAEVGVVYKMWAFNLRYVSVNMFWPIFLVLFILLSFKDVNGFIVTFTKGK